MSLRSIGIRARNIDLLTRLKWEIMTPPGSFFMTYHFINLTNNAEAQAI